MFTTRMLDLGLTASVAIAPELINDDCFAPGGGFELNGREVSDCWDCVVRRRPGLAYIIAKHQFVASDCGCISNCSSPISQSPTSGQRI